NQLEAAARGFGAKLRNARRERKIFLRSVAHETRISMASLRALEAGRIGALPDGIFRRRWIEHVSAVVGLNGDRAWQELLKLASHDGVLAPRRRGTAIPSSRRCRLQHSYAAWIVHGGPSSLVHWTFAECVECGHATLMYP